MGDHASAPTRSGIAASFRKIGALVLALGLAFGPGAASAAVDKHAAYQEMLTLAQQIKSLKPQLRTNAEAAASYSAAELRYRELSLALGGDDPGQIQGGGAAAASRSVRPKVVPSTPAGCGPATANFAQATPTAIPAGPGVVTSTVVVSGAGPYLFDLDLTTNITHTFPGDIDMTLTSPAGTVVTITTDNAGTNDDVFNGTLWDDDANPAGTVPYTTNNGMVTDHAYVISTVATPLAVEEAMAAFLGEDPNGTWTLTVSDDAAGDGGSIDSWALSVTTFPSAPLAATVPTVTQATPTAIPAGPGVVTSTVVVSGAGTSILDLDLTTNIAHTFPGDIDMTLTSPAGTVVTITTDNAGTNDDVFNGTVWDDDANPAGTVPYTTNNGLVTDHAYVISTLASPLVAEEALGAFIGEDPNGTWTLTISDDAAGDGGSLDSWSLDIDTFGCASADLSITKSDGVASATPGGTVTYTIVASNAGPTAANPVTVSDTFPAACSSVSYTSVAAGGATGNTAAGAGNISDAALNLPSGGSVTYTAICTIAAGATGTLDNTATVSSALPDPNAGNNSASDSDTLTPSTDLALTKALTTVGSVAVGDNVVFALTVTNNGPSNATGVVVTDTLPAGLTYVSNDCGAAFAAPTLSWNVGALAVGVPTTCNLTVTVTQAGTTTNTASATGAEADGTTTNNSGSGSVTPQQAIAEVPTLGGFGLVALIALLAVSAAFVLRRRRQV